MRSKEQYIEIENNGDENLITEVLLPVCWLNVPTDNPEQVTKEIIDRENHRLDTNVSAPSPVLVSLNIDANEKEGDEISNREDLNEEDLRNIFDTDNSDEE